MAKLEYTFNGTPNQFATTANIYGHNNNHDANRFYIFRKLMDDKTNPDNTNFIILVPSLSTPRENHYCPVSVHSLPNNKSLITIDISDEAWSTLTQSWNHFCGELQRQGWIISNLNQPANNKVSILFLAADPTDLSRLRLGEELREIQEKLRLSRLRDQFELNQIMSARPADISQAILDTHPQIIHFSGHGSSDGALYFESSDGKHRPVQADALAALFEQFSHQINCVILNACFSKFQAEAIAKHIKFVIGMNQEIGDKAAIAFAIGFYQGLGAGLTTEQSYKLGCVQIGLQDIPQYLAPVLIQKEVT